MIFHLPFLLFIGDDQFQGYEFCYEKPQLQSMLSSMERLKSAAAVNHPPACPGPERGRGRQALERFGQYITTPT